MQTRKFIINEYGALIMKRAGREVYATCPFNSEPESTCGDLCPMFDEPEIVETQPGTTAPYEKRLNICNTTLVGEFEDRRKPGD